MENPSLNYLQNLANGNDQFKSKIIQLLIDELPQEFERYNQAMDSKNYFWASEIVHKIKHKIAFFQMEKSYRITEDHENSLREGKLKYQVEFIEIITKILNFLPNCKN
ncbi:hypothetical protein [Algoriphagus pacificus]|uniref:HPt domain-containing protein n=1 Tax=Algoriphagus pacificus TaxID=2811234 RepID=A0ABS3CGW0_9BACT|nr:hypothetical protein [Algoriphagus pacificus]MBN7816327.1 hypothetical protein [Algoriphagus pacificus]